MRAERCVFTPTQAKGAYRTGGTGPFLQAKRVFRASFKGGPGASDATWPCARGDPERKPEQLKGGEVLWKRLPKIGRLEGRMLRTFVSKMGLDFKTRGGLSQRKGPKGDFSYLRSFLLRPGEASEKI